jgi:hypothetical protein
MASPGFFGIGANFSAKRSYLYLYGLVAVIALPTVVIGVMGAGHAHAAHTAGRMVSHVMPVLLLLAFVGWFAYYNLHNNQKFVVSVTGDARLGRWAYNDKAMGTVLHLHSGADRFVLGGRDHRVGEGTRVDEPPVVGVDAWLPADQFGELLSMMGARSGLDVRSAAPGDPVRCLLFTNAMQVQQTWAFAMAKKRRILQSASHAQLAIDVDADGIRVVDYGSNTLITSARVDQVTAEPATYQYRRWAMLGLPSAGQVLDRVETRYLSVTPEMVVSLPEMTDLTIACRDVAGVSEFRQRFSWRAPVQQRINDPADYAVSAADWLLLVEKFGLTPRLEIHG